MFVKWQDRVYDFEIIIWNHVSDSGKSNAPLDSSRVFHQEFVQQIKIRVMMYRGTLSKHSMDCTFIQSVLFSQNDKDNMHKLYQSTKVEHDKPVEGTVIGRLSVIHIYSPLPFECNRSDLTSF